MAEEDDLRSGRRLRFAQSNVFNESFEDGSLIRYLRNIAIYAVFMVLLGSSEHSHVWTHSSDLPTLSLS